MSSIALETQLRDLYEERIQSAFPWALVESWVLAYIAAEHAKIRLDEWNGLDIAPKAVFRRFAEKVGHPVQFDANGESFNFVA